ncbi:MAG: metal ABC transporter substrate-binding protein [Candidatus Limnocylindria bacterium]
MRSSITAVSVLSILALVGCSGGGPSDDGRLRVVATTTQVGSVAREIGGEDIELKVLLQPGAEAHDYEMTPAAAAAVEDADIILRSGAGLESWLDDALETIGTPEGTRDMSDGVTLREPDEPGDEDDHGGADPHYWLSAPNAVVMVENVEGALAAADAANASAFAERADGLIERLEAADAEIRSLLAEIPDDERGIVTNHDALGYFIDEYGLRFVGSVFPSLDVSAEPGPGELAELVETIRAEDVVAIFSESAVNPELASTIADETDAEVIDEPLYTDSLGPDGSGADTLDGMLLHNATVIHDALVGI